MVARSPLIEGARCSGDHGFSQAAHVEHPLFQLRQLLLKLLHHVTPLAIAALDIHFRLLLRGFQEHVDGRSLFDDLAQQHEDALVTRPPCLCHVVSHDRDRVGLPQAAHQTFDRCRAFSVERRARLIHQNDLRGEREQACDTELLLLLQCE